MMVLGIDPGPKQSAYLIWDTEEARVQAHGILDNMTLREWLMGELSFPTVPVIEMVQSFGMPVGKEIFETVLFIGRMIEIFRGNANLVYRKDIKTHYCMTTRATDANIRQALIDRFGPPGTKKEPGKLYGIKKDEWSALALAVYYTDKLSLASKVQL